MEQHLCVGPTCWTCGEPVELREMRLNIADAFSGKTANDPHRLAKLATDAIREDVINMMTLIVELNSQIRLLQQPPMTRIEIDPNVRVRGNQTMTGMQYVHGPIVIGQQVEVFESEAEIIGDGWVADIDEKKQLVYLRVVWSSLRDKEKQDGVPVE